MKLLFNKGDQGNTEIKSILGFVDAGFSYKNIEPDVKLQTPYLIELIGQELYDKIEAFYADNNSVPEGERPDHQTVLDYMQLYIMCMAYLDFAPNNDLSHTTSGRSFRNEDNEKIPWQWQLEEDNKAIAKRGYRALDHLFTKLDKLQWTEWTSSDAYKKANQLFVKTTLEFDNIFPIDKSGQLYYRLVPFMQDIEKDYIIPILTEATATTLKEASDPSDAQKELIRLSRNIAVYKSLAKGFKSFPVEMMPKGLTYHENTAMKSKARAEVMLGLKNEADRYLQMLEHEYQTQNQSFETLNTTNGLSDGKKYVSL